MDQSQNKYEVDILVNNDWKFVYSDDDMNKIDRVIYEISKKGIYSRVLENGILLTFIHGDDHGYWFFKNKYVRNKGLDFDYTKSYYEHCKKKEKK